MPICSNWLHLTPNTFYARTLLVGFTHRHVITPTRSHFFARAVTSESTMAAASNSVRVAAAQMTSVNDLAVNFATCSSLVKEAVSAGAKLLCLPEAFSYVGARDGDSVKIAEPLDGPIMQRYCSLARESSIWLSLGGFQEKGSDDEHLHNTHVVIDDTGNIRSTYRKIHLFDVDVPGGRNERSAFSNPKLARSEKKGMKSVSLEQSLLQESLLPCLNKVGVSNFFTLWLMKLILYVSSSAATISLLLPQQMVDGTTVPSLFRDLPNLYQIFLISTVFAFVGAFSSLMIQHKPRVERFFRIIAVASILFALVIVLYATALWLR